MTIGGREAEVRTQGHAGPVPAPFFDTLSPDARPSLEAQVPFPSRLGRPGEYAMMLRHAVDTQPTDLALRPVGAIRMASR